MKGRDDKPGLDLLPEKKRMSYGEDLKKKLSSTIRGNKEVQSRDKFTKREVKALMTRHLLGLAVDLKKSEFDILVTLKVQFVFFSTNIIHQTKQSRILLQCFKWRSKLTLRELKNSIQMD